MHRRTVQRSPALPTILAMTLGVIGVGAATGQTATRYSWRELPKVAAAQYCAVDAGGLNESGDVAMVCQYKGGTRQETAYWCLGGNLCFPYKASRAWYYRLPAVWQGGVLRSLAVTSRVSTWQVWMRHSGQVMATGVALDANGYTSGNGLAWTWAPSSNLGEPYLPPAALSDPEEMYTVDQVTPGGLVIWGNVDGRRHAAQWPDGRVEPVPGIPDNGEPVNSELAPIVNDRGMIVRSRWVIAPPTPTQPFQNHVPQGWFFDGQQWTKMPPSPVSTGLTYSRVNAQGHVLGHTVMGAQYLWRAQQPEVLTEVAPAGQGQARLLNDAGLLAGAVPIPNDRNARTRATVWVQGQQPVDLNTVTANLPRGFLLTSVTALNNKGQMVVNALDTSRWGVEVSRTLLLTPQ